jgi:hypothetical protein
VNGHAAAIREEDVGWMDTQWQSGKRMWSGWMRSGGRGGWVTAVLYSSANSSASASTSPASTNCRSCQP